jgi:hypothetical protein
MTLSQHKNNFWQHWVGAEKISGDTESMQKWFLTTPVAADPVAANLQLLLSSGYAAPVTAASAAATYVAAACAAATPMTAASVAAAPVAAAPGGGCSSMAASLYQFFG